MAYTHFCTTSLLNCSLYCITNILFFVLHHYWIVLCTVSLHCSLCCITFISSVFFILNRCWIVLCTASLLYCSLHCIMVILFFVLHHCCIVLCTASCCIALYCSETADECLHIYVILLWLCLAQHWLMVWHSICTEQCFSIELSSATIFNVKLWRVLYLYLHQNCSLV